MVTGFSSARAQHQAHKMTMLQLGRDWMAIGIAQAFPSATMELPSESGWPLERRGLYLTQPALMMNLESQGSLVALRATLNAEGITQPGGELTFGAWGEGFLDKRHPHTILHEIMLSLNFWRGESAGISISAGKGFAPYGTDDPMMRPVIKYPTNHHLSQLLERWLVSGTWSDGHWSVEAGVFGGTEPSGPFDFGNVESFANSWSTRLTYRVGTPTLAAWPWEFSLSVARVREHEDQAGVNELYNAALRYEREHGDTRAYALLEASWGNETDGNGVFSVLAEGSLTRGRHKPYARLEYATRPEYTRVGPPNSRAFFRYDHDLDSIGATRWLILSAGYGWSATLQPLSVRPYIETQFNNVQADWGGIDPVDLYGRRNFLVLSAGLRVFLGGEPMRMGAYGILDPMTAMHRVQMQAMQTEHKH
ncbi:MAG: hypothetical protein ACRENP_20760, partial [Longimicrobiales bacterium]